jgi:hypothetical protein
MRLRGILAELRHRGVLKVATAYLAAGFVVLEGVSILFQNFEAPHWVLKVFSTLVVLGFPVACAMAWGFEFTSQGVHSAPPLNGAAPAKPGRADAFFGGLLVLTFVLVAAMVVRQWRTPAPTDGAQPVVTAAAQPIPGLVVRTHDTLKSQRSTAELPVVIIMDTSASHGVYEPETREKSGTNADDLNEVLRDLPIVIQKETVGADWERDDQVLKQHPDLIMIHRSAFFHSMNQEFGFGYPGESTDFDETRARRLYEIADNKLMAFLGFIGQGNPDTLFLVYSRGTGGGWSEEKYRSAWIGRVDGRFPSLRGRVMTVNVPGGTNGGSFEDERTAQMFRQQVRDLLKLVKAGNS